MTKFKVGDRVTIKSKEWFYKQKKDKYGNILKNGAYFLKSDIKTCGKSFMVDDIDGDWISLHGFNGSLKPWAIIKCPIKFNTASEIISQNIISGLGGKVIFDSIANTAANTASLAMMYSCFDIINECVEEQNVRVDMKIKLRKIYAKTKIKQL